MNKRILLISSILLTFVLSCLVLYNVNNNNDRLIVENVKSNNKVVSSNALTMMYETEAGSGEYQVSSDTSWLQDGYVFNEQLSRCENGSTLKWDSETNRVIMSTSVSDRCYFYFDKEPDTINLVNYIIENVYTGTDGDNGLYYHDGVGSYTNADQEAGDYSYRYAGANPNNYVCFGSDAGTCPTDNLYRIIGVFDEQVKLIKADYANSNLLGTNGDYYGNYGSLGSYYKGSLSAVDAYFWNANRSNTWSASQLNTINLNQNYLSNIGSEWASKIATHTWQVGGATYANVYSSPVKTAHTYEVGASTANTTYNAKIGLIYVSDYGYAASPANWSANMGSLNNATNRDNNWMFMGLYEWTISRRSDGSDRAFYVLDAGHVFISNVSYYMVAVRPSFYLESDVTYVSGDGSINLPFRIN